MVRGAARLRLVGPTSAIGSRARERRRGSAICAGHFMYMSIIHSRSTRGGAAGRGRGPKQRKHGTNKGTTTTSDDDTRTAVAASVHSCVHGCVVEMDTETVAAARAVD